MVPGAHTSRSNTPNRVVSNHPPNSSVTVSQSVNTTPPIKRTDSNSPSLQNLAKTSPQNLSTGIYPPNSLDCIPILSRNGSPGLYSSDKDPIDTNAFVCANNSSNSGTDTTEQASNNILRPQITSNCTPEIVAHWLNKNRYSNHLNSFQYYNGRDILRYEMFLLFQSQNSIK